eukprot:TRINITY_DN1525_c0_g1_i4.p3 TRINITY_DN1525_c0_g1~~TRINITY_DN1525_c0_g1_i4.p3  ORF type:complete len:102 (-),score=10.75 TRINITY_DN1525_c0_g1_i4:764-1069(-)
MQSKFLEVTAKNNGGLSSLSEISILAPLFISNTNSCLIPTKHAICSGVIPSKFCASTLAPNSNRVLVFSILPNLTAMCNGVSRLELRQFTLASNRVIKVRK